MKKYLKPAFTAFIFPAVVIIPFQFIALLAGIASEGELAFELFIVVGLVAGNFASVDRLKFNLTRLTFVYLPATTLLAAAGIVVGSWIVLGNVVFAEIMQYPILALAPLVPALLFAPGFVWVIYCKVNKKHPTERVWA